MAEWLICHLASYHTWYFLIISSLSITTNNHCHSFKLNGFHQNPNTLPCFSLFIWKLDGSGLFQLNQDTVFDSGHFLRESFAAYCDPALPTQRINLSTWFKKRTRDITLYFALKSQTPSHLWQSIGIYVADILAINQLRGKNMCFWDLKLQSVENYHRYVPKITHT